MIDIPVWHTNHIISVISVTHIKPYINGSDGNLDPSLRFAIRRNRRMSLAFALCSRSGTATYMGARTRSSSVRPSRSEGERASRTRTAGSSVSKCLRAPGSAPPGRRMEVVHGLSETASKQRCCTRLTCRSLTAVCARLTLRARAPMLVAHRRRREKMAPGMCAPMAVRSSPCDPSSCTDLISSQTTFYLSQTRAESLVLTWSIFSVGPLTNTGQWMARKVKCSYLTHTVLT